MHLYFILTPNVTVNSYNYCSASLTQVYYGARCWGIKLPFLVRRGNTITNNTKTIFIKKITVQMYDACTTCHGGSIFSAVLIALNTIPFKEFALVDSKKAYFIDQLRSAAYRATFVICRYFYSSLAINKNMSLYFKYSLSCYFKIEIPLYATVLLQDHKRHRLDTILVPE